jgi:benzil reductase ((S)-benzoin forming)
MNALAFITGTSSGIGLALARQLLTRGWRVAGLSRRVSPIDHPQYRHIQLDLADLTTLSRELPRFLEPLIAEQAWTPLALVNNAAAPGGFGGVESISPQEIQHALAVDCEAPIWLMGLVSKLTPAGTRLRIVNISSGAAHGGYPGLSLYGASKAALRIAGQSLAAEWDSAERPGGKRQGAAILSYEPGVVDTEIQSYARTRPKSEFPWVQMFRDFEAQGMLVPADRVTAPIISFLENPRSHGWREERYSG